MRLGVGRQVHTKHQDAAEAAPWCESKEGSQRISKIGPFHAKLDRKSLLPADESHGPVSGGQERL